MAKSAPPKVAVTHPIGMAPEVTPAEPEVPSLPSMLEMAKNAGGSLWRNTKAAVRGEKLKLTKEEAERRLDICRSCPFFRKDDERCSKCGCYLSSKTYLKAEHCPVGKW